MKANEINELDRDFLQALPLEDKITYSKKIIEAVLNEYENVGMGFSGGTDSRILLHLVLDFNMKIPVIFVNTNYQFPETYEYVDKIRKKYALNFHEAKSKDQLYEKMKQRNLGDDFFLVCCEYHKIRPMKEKIDELKLDGFLTGIRGVEHPERAKETIISKRETHDRVNPMLFWTKQDALDYVKLFDLEVNPLYKRGYKSLGCMQCTKIIEDENAHERAGRHQTREKIMERLRALGYT